MFSLSTLAEWIALVGATVHTQVPGAEPLRATVLLRDGRIEAVGADVKVPSEARTIDVAGMHIVPGLIDGLAYLDPEHDPLFAAFGVTLVCDQGNNLGRIFDAREAQSGARASGPAVRLCGAVIDGIPPSTNEALLVKKPEEAALILGPLFEQKVDFISVQTQLGADAWHKVIELAHAKGLQVWGPLPKGVDLAQALAAGQDGVLFLDSLLPAGAKWDQAAPDVFDPVVEKLRASKLRIVPLLLRDVLVARDPGNDAPQLRWLSPQYTAQWLGELQARRFWLEAKFLERSQRATALEAALVKRLFDAGVRLVPGSGCPHPWLLPGESLHDELELWQKAGIPAAGVLRAATSGAAEAFGIERERGRIAAGAIADLLVVREDPTVSISALRRPEFVVLRGRVLDRKALDEGLEALAAGQKREREAASRTIEVAAPVLPEGKLLLSGFAQTAALGVRSGAERWAIVRTSPEVLAFCGRVVIPQGPEKPPVELEVRQDLKGKWLEGFEIHLRGAKHELVVRGFAVAEQMRVERKVDGLFVDNQVAPQKIAAVDIGSVTTLMLLAHTQEDGTASILRFHEGLELELVRWELNVAADGGHLFRTPQGGKLAVFDANGGLRAAREQQGSGSSETQSTIVVPEGGAGLPLSEKKRGLLANPAPASAKKPEPAPPAKKQD
jgi:amidohydrolase family protein